ncbi:MAG: Putative metal-dependent hydrolase YfiT [uncultured Gemmatimonadaceae bacterium]|uniref:Metal-dependent hydrolase YfiT n=1 Tax=uncultured Gemmatimonadaceae bacterium TaxID=246130 RepID=A0A6J4KIK0_9BACT|nr:MAG: Putative metal-dependent hydrolase YfiT [uncultured Gemmatimonadaceae bacterium]
MPETATPPDDLRYPVGRHEPVGEVTAADRARWIGEVAALPAGFRAAVAGLDAAQLETPYRPGGWTVRQLVHHLADSHLNAYTRCKLALTEAEPTIKPYDEARWAELPDVAAVDPAVSLALLDALHLRWAALLERLTPDHWARTLRHPERPRPMRLDDVLALYAWHGRHHTAHVTRLRERMGW